MESEPQADRRDQPSPVPPGTLIRLGRMRSQQPPVAAGTYGTVQEGSSGAELRMRWADGRMLPVVPGVDEFEAMWSVMERLAPRLPSFRPAARGGDERR